MKNLHPYPDPANDPDPSRSGSTTLVVYCTGTKEKNMMNADNKIVPVSF